MYNTILLHTVNTGLQVLDWNFGLMNNSYNWFNLRNKMTLLEQRTFI